MADNLAPSWIQANATIVLAIIALIVGVAGGAWALADATLGRDNPTRVEVSEMIVHALQSANIPTRDDVGLIVRESAPYLFDEREIHARLDSLEVAKADHGERITINTTAISDNRRDIATWEIHLQYILEELGRIRSYIERSVMVESGGGVSTIGTGR